MQKLLNLLYFETFGDRLQLMNVLNSYYRATTVYTTALNRNLQQTIEQCAPVILQGSLFKNFIEWVDAKFETAIVKCYSDFSDINKSLLTNHDIDEVIKKYMTSLPSHYHTMKDMLNFSRKEKLVKNLHLTCSNHYNKLLLIIVKSQARIMNSHHLIHYAMVTTGACYGRGVKAKSMYHSTTAGLSTTYGTMLQRLEQMNNNMDINSKCF